MTAQAQPMKAGGADLGAAPANARKVLITLVIVAAVANLPLAMANVALPSIGKFFNASQIELNLVAVAYSLGLACSVLWLGALGDRYGRKMMAILGVSLAIPAALISGFAPTIQVLFFGRLFGGFAAGMAYPTTLALIAALWGPGPARTRSIALWAALGGAISVSGPLLAGVILHFTTWPWVFFIVIPLAAVAIFLALRNIPAHVNETTEKVDNFGGILSVILVGSFVLAINFITMAQYKTVAIELLVVAVIAAVVFIIRQRRAKFPLYDLKYGCTPDVLGGGGCRDHYLRLADGRHVHRPAVYAGCARLWHGAICPAADFRGGDDDPGRTALGKNGGIDRLPRHAAARLCVHPDRLPDHAVLLGGRHLLLGGGDRVHVRRGWHRSLRDPGVTFAHRVGAGH